MSFMQSGLSFFEEKASSIIICVYIALEIRIALPSAVVSMSPIQIGYLYVTFFCWVAKVRVSLPSFRGTRSVISMSI